MAIDIIARGMIEESSGDVSQLSEKVNSHTENGDIHVTATDKDNWNGYATEIVQNKTDISNVKTDIQNLQNQDNVLSSRIDNLSTLPEGSTTADAELADIRVGADGTTYDNAGTAIRTQIGELKEDLDDICTTVTNLFIPSEVTVGKYMGKTGVVYTNETYCYTGYIPVTQGQVIKFSRHDENYDHVYMRFVTAFNSDMGVNVNAGTEKVVEYTVPANVRYIIISFEKVVYSDTNVTRLAIYSKSSYDGDFIPSGETLSELNGEKLNPKYSEIVNTVSLSNEVANFCSNEIAKIKQATISTEQVKETHDESEYSFTSGYMDTKGITHSSSSQEYSEKIPVSDCKKISANNNFRFVTAFNEDLPVESSGATKVREYEIPQGVTHIVVTIYAGLSYRFTFTKNEESYSNNLKSDVDLLKSRLENKLSPQEIKGITQTGYNVMNDVSRVEEGKQAYASVGSTYSYTTNSTYDVVEIPVKTGVYTVTSRYIRFAMIADRDNKVLFADNKPSTSKGYKMEVTDDMTNAKLVITILHGDISYSKISMNGLKPYNEYTVDDKWVFSKGVENPIIHAYLPKEIYVAVGRTIEIYNKQVCLEAEKYHVQWDCTIGKALKRKFSVTGVADIVGNHTLVCRIYNDSKAEVWTGTTTIKVVEQLSGTYTGVPIGDSLTNAKKWLPEVVGLSNSKISYVGHYSATLQDSNSVSHVIGHEGRSGYTSQNYLNGSPYTYGGGNEPNHNVFWNETTERFDWNNYKLTQNLNPDFVQIYLGTNELSDDNTEAANRIKQMVDLIRQDDSAIPIFVVNTIYFGNQNGIGVQRATDGYSATLKGWWKFNQDCKVMDLMIKLDNALSESTGVYMINLAITHDYEYNFGAVETPVNPRATQTELMPTEGVHPQAQGYYQMADVIYSTYCGVLS